MKEIPDNCVDLIIADPPYNISKLNDNRDRSKLNAPIFRRKSPLRYDFGKWDNLERQEFLDFTQRWLFESIRLLKREGATMVSFFNKEDISFLGWLAKTKGVRTRTIISWHKTNPVPSFRKVNYLSACEFIWIGSIGKWTFNFGKQKDMHNFFETANSSAYGETEHPTEKPKSLISHLIKIHSNKNNTVLDLFSGSGTTAVACRELNRNFIGIERNPEYCKIAGQRLKNTTKPLF